MADISINKFTSVVKLQGNSASVPSLPPSLEDTPPAVNPPGTGINPSASTFLQLTDTPALYTGQGAKAVSVKSDETGLEFIDFPTVTGGDEPAVKTTASADQALPSGVLTILDYDSTLTNNATLIYSVGTDGRITVSDNGVFDITAGVVIEADALTALESAFLGIFRNGNLIAISSINTTIAAGASSGLSCSTQIALLSGDIIDCRALVTSVGGVAPGLARRIGTLLGANATQVNSLAIVKCISNGQSFLQLSDTPASYTSQAGLFPRVNSGGTGLEFFNVLNNPLTGYTVGSNTALADTDTILGAFGKVQGQINAKIGGTISSGQVAFGTGTGTIGGEDLLRWSTVQKTLFVGSNDFATNSVLNITESASRIYALNLVNRNSNKSYIFGVDTVSVDDGWFQLRDNTLNAVRMAVTSGGNLLINRLTDQGSKVQVDGTIYSNGNSYTGLQVNYTTGFGLIQLTRNNSRRLYLGSSVGADTVVQFGAVGDDGVERPISIQRATGNTGILTTSPTNTLDVNGTARIRTLSNATGDFVTASATGVLQKRTAAEVVSDLGISAGLWTDATTYIYRNGHVVIGSTATAGLSSQLNIVGALGSTTFGTVSIYNSNTGGVALSVNNGVSTSYFQISGAGFVSANSGLSVTRSTSGSTSGHLTVQARSGQSSTHYNFVNRDASGNIVMGIMTDGHIGSNTTNGIKIGTATTQKLGFWNATPIVQPTTAVTGATLVGGGGTTITDTDTFDGYTLAQVVKALRNIGLLA